MIATHRLKSRGRASSAGLEHREARQPLTNWRAKHRHRQQASNARHSSHSQSGEPRKGVVSRLQTQSDTVATHRLVSQGKASAAGFKRSEARQSLTSWIAE